MKLLLLALCVASTGCLIVPANKTTTKTTGTSQSEVTHGRIRQLVLRGGAAPAKVIVQATHKRDCHRNVFDVVETRTSKVAKLGGSDDPRAQIFGFLLSPVLIPVSAIVTSFIIAGDNDETSEQLKLKGKTTFECTTPAGAVALQLTFPSGATYLRTTDAHGELSFPIPETEPYTGLVAVQAGDAPAQSIRYEQPIPVMTIARDAIQACRATHQIGAVTVKLTIGSTGRPTRLWLSVGDEQFGACIKAKLSGTQFPAAMHSTIVALPFDGPAATAVTAAANQLP